MVYTLRGAIHFIFFGKRLEFCHKLETPLAQRKTLKGGMLFCLLGSIMTIFKNDVFVFQNVAMLIFQNRIKKTENMINGFRPVMLFQHNPIVGQHSQVGTDHLF